MGNVPPSVELIGATNLYDVGRPSANSIVKKLIWCNIDGQMLDGVLAN